MHTQKLCIPSIPGKPPSGEVVTFSNTKATFKGLNREEATLLQEAQARTGLTPSCHMEVLVGMPTRWGAISKVKGIMGSSAEDRMLSTCESLYFQESPVHGDN